MTKNKKGFTLIELLVVVLIIGVLAAIALPMYQKAVLKSRFAALMPIVKSMNDSNEAYYLEHMQYASNPQDLPVQGQLEYPTGTQLEFGQNMDYAYVLASNPDARNNYIMYQKHSANYPGEIHCEALVGDDDAQAVCLSYGTNNIGTTLTNGYTTYVISGTGFGLAPGSNDPNCNKADAMPGYTCLMDTNAQGKTVKKVCTEVNGSNICRFKTYNEDGSYTSVTCKTDGEGNCTTTGSRSATEVTYDADGNKVMERICPREYNINTGTCGVSGAVYEWASYTGVVYEYDGNTVRKYACERPTCSSEAYKSFTEDTYDDAGHKLTERACKSYSNHECTNWGSTTFYTYDGDLLTSSGPDESGAIRKGTTVYSYNTAGQLTSKRTCGFYDTRSGCYGWNDERTFEYDENGRLSKEIETKNGNYYEYVYDDEGNRLTSTASFTHVTSLDAN